MSWSSSDSGNVDVALMSFSVSEVVLVEHPRLPRSCLYSFVHGCAFEYEIVGGY